MFSLNIVLDASKRNMLELSMNNFRTRGFSLVELSIVLVILGLLTGGILAGQSLIRASQLRAVTSEFSRYKTAIGAFRDKYFMLPGDINNATTFWTAGTCPGTNANTTSPQGNTCNGDGDWAVEFSEASSTTSNGVFRAWQHLAMAGLVEGSYTGVSDNAGYSTAVASFTTPNIPSSKLSNAGWLFYYAGNVASDSTFYYAGSYGNTFVYGAPAGLASLSNPVIRPEEAWNLDTKLDDGKPATGSVVSFYTQNGTGATNCGDKATAAYTLTATGINCALFFKSGY